MPFDPEGGTGERNAVNLTRTRSNAWRPEFSPDGKQIAFSSESWGHDYASKSPYERNGGKSIKVINVDGTGLRDVVEGQTGSPEWSPDGKRIYFFQHVPDRVPDVAENVGVIHSIGLDRGAMPENLNWKTGPAYGVKIGIDGRVLVNGLEPHPTGQGVGVGSWRPRVMERRSGADSFSEMKGPAGDFSVSDIGPNGQMLAEAELPRNLMRSLGCLSVMLVTEIRPTWTCIRGFRLTENTSPLSRLEAALWTNG
jgi:dipeptidyl aminopeptidase/acylaminoacyl peptidase